VTPATVPTTHAIEARLAPLAAPATTLEPKDGVLASLQLTNCVTTKTTTTEAELPLPASLHFRNYATAMTEAGLALPAAPATTQEPKDGVLASLPLTNCGAATMTTEAGLAIPASIQLTNCGAMTMTIIAGLAIPASIQLTNCDAAMTTTEAGLALPHCTMRWGLGGGPTLLRCT
jgi:hypothetical protein